jgi:rhamnosyltransferase
VADIPRQPHVVKDLPSRRWKAEKIERLLGLGASGPPLRILDVGTGSGGIGNYFGTHASGRYRVDSVDVNDERLVHEGYSFRQVTDAALPFEDASFDLVVSNHVIEHVGLETEQRYHLAELRRVLKPEGRGYLAVPNRWMLVEPHYRLAFLSWLPHALRTPYLRASGKGEVYDCEPLQMRQLEGYLRDTGLQAANRSVDALRATLEIEHPDAFATRVVRRLPDWLLSLFRRLIPTHIYTFLPDASGARPLARGDDPAQLACVTVTFAPDLEVLRRQLAQLPAAALKVLVDNGSPAPALESLRALAAETGALLVENGANLGLARALNIGAKTAAAARPGLAMLLLLDQDAEPGAGSVPALLAAWARLRSIDPALGCIGPALTDATTGALHGFHRIAGWRWSQVRPAGTEPVRVDNLNGSGTLVRAELFDRLGGLAAELFIDHVDTDWAFRVRAAGYTLYGIPDVRFLHRMGESGIRFWCFGWRVWPRRSPSRHYYLFRNTVRLLRAREVPWVWKGWAMVKLALTFGLYLVLDPERGQQARNMWRGLRDGLRPWDRNAR